jgi:hypothetical protein
MTEPLTDSPRTSFNGTTARTNEDTPAAEPLQDPEAPVEPAQDSAPGIPRWVKAFGIILVVVLLAVAGLHLTGNAPTHLPGSGGPQHGLEKTP